GGVRRVPLARRRGPGPAGREGGGRRARAARRRARPRRRRRRGPQPDRPSDARPGPRTRGRRAHRTVRRRPVPDQGPGAALRGAADGRRVAVARDAAGRAARRGGPALAGRRAGGVRQDHDPRVRGEGGHRARAHRADPQPVGPDPHPRRVVGRVRGRRRRRGRAGGGGQRRRRLDPHPRRVLRAVRAQAGARPRAGRAGRGREPARRRVERGGVPVGAGHRGDARRPRRPRPRRSLPRRRTGGPLHRARRARAGPAADRVQHRLPARHAGRRRGGRGGAGRGGAAGVARARGRAGDQRGRRAPARPGLPHDVVRGGRPAGRLGPDDHRLRSRRLRARHPADGRAGPGHPGPGLPRRARPVERPHPRAGRLPRALRPAAHPDAGAAAGADRGAGRAGARRAGRARAARAARHPRPRPDRPGGPARHPEPRPVPLHPAGEHHRAPGDVGAAALDGHRPAARRPVRRTARRRGPHARARGAAGGRAALVRPAPAGV
ncbi:MAG: Putative amidase MSMEG_6673, partial [uncultured Pseudonocardia sp.]